MATLSHDGCRNPGIIVQTRLIGIARVNGHCERLDERILQLKWRRSQPFLELHMIGVQEGEDGVDVYQITVQKVVVWRQ